MAANARRIAAGTRKGGLRIIADRQNTKSRVPHAPFFFVNICGIIFIYDLHHREWWFVIYFREHELLQTPSLTIAQLNQFLLDRLGHAMSRHRALHVLGVTHTVAMLAALHGMDSGQAALAALLHDQSKELHPEEIRNDLKRRGVPIPREDLEFPRIWHGLHAAVWGREERGSDGVEIFQAVSLHSTADAAVKPLTLALFIADFCEPGRHLESAPAVFAMAKQDLAEAFRMAMLCKLKHMARKKTFKLHPRALRAAQAYLPRGSWEMMLPGGVRQAWQWTQEQ